MTPPPSKGRSLQCLVLKVARHKECPVWLWCVAISHDIESLQHELTRGGRLIEPSLSSMRRWKVASQLHGCFLIVATNVLRYQATLTEANELFP